MNTKVSPKVSERMKKQRIFDTKPESEIAKACFAKGLRYRKNVEIPEVKTRGDLVFRKHKLVVFVDGCFWHGCPWHYRTPKTRSEWWDAKIEKNKKRDVIKTRKLRRLGWKVVRVWEHVDPDKAANKILNKTKEIDR
jgi:DNA mismatch endonuclease (patch repair protein)